MDKDPPGTSKGSTGPGDPADGATPPRAMLTEKDVEAIAELMLKKFKDHESAEPKEKGSKFTHRPSRRTHHTQPHAHIQTSISTAKGQPWDH